MLAFLKQTWVHGVMSPHGGCASPNSVRRAGSSNARNKFTVKPSMTFPRIFVKLFRFYREISDDTVLGNLGETSSGVARGDGGGPPRAALWGGGKILSIFKDSEGVKDFG